MVAAVVGTVGMCVNSRKRRSCGKRCLRAVGRPAAFPSGRECRFPSAERLFSHFHSAKWLEIALVCCASAQEDV